MDIVQSACLRRGLHLGSHTEHFHQCLCAHLCVHLCVNPTLVPIDCFCTQIHSSMHILITPLNHKELSYIQQYFGQGGVELRDYTPGDVHVQNHKDMVHNLCMHKGHSWVNPFLCHYHHQGLLQWNWRSGFHLNAALIYDWFVWFVINAIV